VGTPYFHFWGNALLPACHCVQVMRSNAKRALLRFTDAAIASLKEDDDELMQGQGSFVCPSSGQREQPLQQQ
jgi:predicted RNA-binding protein YlxR (DUF448 family)